MSKKPQFDKEGALEAGVGSPPTTIVGGQRRRGLHQEVQIPVGIERALYLAATDVGFRPFLLARRAAAACQAGLPLTDTEASVLDHQDAASLEAAIDRLRPTDCDRRKLLQVVAASFVSVAAGTAGGSSCTIDGYQPPNDGGYWHDVESHYCDGCVADVPQIPDVLPLDDAQVSSDASVQDAALTLDASVPDASVPDASLPDASQGRDGGVDGGP